MMKEGSSARRRHGNLLAGAASPSSRRPASPVQRSRRQYREKGTRGRRLPLLSQHKQAAAAQARGRLLSLVVPPSGYLMYR